MNYRWLVVFVVLAAFGAGAWMLLKPPEMAPASSAAMPAAAEPLVPARKLPEVGKTAEAPPASVPVAAPAASAKRGPTPLYAEFLAAKQLRGLYDRLNGSPEGQTAEGQYLLYEILRRCATVSDRTSPRPPARALPRREDFVASLSPNDPNRDKRLAAYEQVEGNRCAGFENVTVTQAELNRLLADSAGSGDAKARALMVEAELQQRRPGGRSPTEAQLETLRQVAATRDPGAIMVAGRLFSNTYHDLTVRIGPDGQVAEPRALYNAWQMLACEYGYPCGQDNAFMLTECALRSHCQTSSLQDFLGYYGSSVHDSQLVAQYQQILRNALTTGDWSQVAIVRGARPPGAPRMFFPPR
jgi:hypothetical protein